MLVVGVEQITKTRGPEIGKNLRKLSAGGRCSQGAFGKIAAGYFQCHGDQSNALAMSARRTKPPTSDRCSFKGRLRQENPCASAPL